MRRSLSVRLAVWCALAAGGAAACVAAVGYPLYRDSLVHRLDRRITIEYRQICGRLGPAYRSLTARQLARTIRSMVVRDQVPVYVEVSEPQRPGTRSAPQAVPLHRYDASIAGAARLRIETFDLPPFHLAIGMSRQGVSRDLRRFLELCSVLGVALLGAGALTGFGVGQAATRDVRRMRAALLRLDPAKLDERIGLSGTGDEVAGLGAALNQLLDRLQHTVLTMRAFTAEACHEIKTPLTLIHLQTEQLARHGLCAPQEAAVQMQREELSRLNRIVEDLSFLARAGSGAISLRARLQCPAAFLRAFAEDARALAEHRGRRFELHCAGEGPVPFEPGRIRQVLLNLLINALNASPPHGRVTLRSRVGCGFWRVSVEDEGPGVPAADRERIFERFTRLGGGASDVQGCGLGLPIARSIITLHHGRIWAESDSSGGGLRMIFEIPIGDETKTKARDLAGPSHVRGVLIQRLS